VVTSTDPIGRPPLPKPASGAGDDGASLSERIGRLISAQPYAVLCTQGGGQPYGSLVAFAFTPDLQSFMFATPVSTRKYRLLAQCDRVAIVVDSRAGQANDLIRVEAITATGRAVRLEGGPELDQAQARLSGRHPHLTAFFQDPTTALFRVDVARYLHVSRFQETTEWILAPGG